LNTNKKQEESIWGKWGQNRLFALANHRLQPLGHSSIYLMTKNLPSDHLPPEDHDAGILATQDRKTAKRKLSDFISQIENKEAGSHRLVL